MVFLNIPESYLKYEIDEDVIMVLKGPLAELMVKVYPSLYRKYLNTKLKGKPILYVKMHNTLYGMQLSALLF